MLTKKEIQVLHFLAKGMSYKSIAFNCAIPLDTVRGRIRNIYKKLKVHSKTEAAMKAIEMDVVNIHNDAARPIQKVYHSFIPTDTI